MTSAFTIACVLALAVIVASARILWRLRLGAAGDKPRAWRVVALLLAQAASATLLYCVLLPPAVRSEAGTLVVLTAAADRAGQTGRSPGAHLVAMPEAPASRDAERVPDLATALRRYPATSRIRVIGTGLTARDQQAAEGRALDFVPAPLSRGLVALWSPSRVQAGRQFHIGGRGEGLRGGSAELLDPARHVVARAAIDADDRFELPGIARSAGPATWQLRLRDRDKLRIEDATLALVVEPGAALQVLMLAGAPNPELKYLRRWATDAGLSLDTRISLGAGMQIGDAPMAFDAASLGKLDLVVLDQRTWQALGDTRRAALDAAVRNGLGLLLHLPGALSGNDRVALRRLGFTASPGGTASEVRLPVATTTLDDNVGAQGEPLPALGRGPVRISAIDGSPLLRDASGTPLASWRARGLGRIGIATFDDSFRLVLAGHRDRHAELWGTLFSTLARPRGLPGPVIEGDPRPGQRVVMCGVGDAPAVDEPDGQEVALAIDPASGAKACAGFWPRLPGWHLLRDGERGTVFHVRATSDAPGLQAAALREATQGLVAAGHPAATAITATPGRRWPWFLGWLLLSAVLWWFERSRVGAARSTTTASAA